MPNVVVTLPPVDPAEALPIVPQVISRLGVLWGSGRLRTLTETEEGLRAVHTFEVMLGDVRNQLASHDGKPGTQMRLRIEIPEDASRGMATFVRRMLDMIADPSVMGPLDQEQLSEGDRSFAEPYIIALEAGIADHEFEQRKRS